MPVGSVQPCCGRQLLSPGRTAKLLAVFLT
jgi:hypothetical protein